MNRNDAFNKLQTEWYNKLKEEGFEDIEQDGEERLLKEWDFNFFRNKYDEITYQTTLIYYDKAKKLLKTYPFRNDTHRSIWQMHCNGLTEREIAKRVGTYKKSMIHHILSPIKKTIRRD